MNKTRHSTVIARSKATKQSMSKRLKFGLPRSRWSFAMTTFVFILCLVITTHAHAACTNPAGNEGEVVYNEDYRIVQYCDNINWVAAMKRGAPTAGDCTTPTRVEGTIIYNADDNVPQICIGGWQALGPINAAAGTGGCSTPTKAEGTIIYNDDDNVMQYCDGSQWVKLLGPAPQENCPGANIGDMCADDTVYAGISPDDNSRMFVARCDIGMLWDGTSCTGSRSLKTWNNGNTSGYVTTGVTHTWQGKSNTQSLIGIDSDSVNAGVQLHQAAQACADLTVHGHSDWYLPAKDELNVIYENLVDATPNDNAPDPLITGFNTAGVYYWSSTEYANAHAQYQRFSDGYQTSNVKYLATSIRCARR